ncbi:hypothetical protein SAMN04487911_12339 [Arenibacter nanhaiticus]|uniref:Uncharacterized protein n=1 Tax=Arenibacter nanhaiticus TaxID=558155 RepID=A0A1M6JW45_9FLAO|nr:hypothetical protein SAMN04487911_12339 [Arenibacter nanhaiticus]
MFWGSCIFLQVSIVFLQAVRCNTLGVPSFVGRALGCIPCAAAGMPPRSLTQPMSYDTQESCFGKLYRIFGRYRCKTKILDGKGNNSALVSAKRKCYGNHSLLYRSGREQCKAINENSLGSVKRKKI